MKKKASKGRPKHPAGMRAKVMSLWISPQREKKIKARAKRQGVSVSEAIGLLIDEAED
jgi:hypothetical protein